MQALATDESAAPTRIGGVALFATVFTCAFVVPLFPQGWHRLAYTGLYAAIFLMAALSLERRPRKLLALAAAVALLEWASGIVDAFMLSTLSQMINTVFFLLVAVGLIAQIARTRNVNGRVILAAVNGYLLLGLAASAAMALTVEVSPGAIDFPAANLAAGTRASDFVYFGFVTLTTMGYGDVLPRTPQAKSLAILTGVVGQLYLAIIIAMLVGKLASRRN